MSRRSQLKPYKEELYIDPGSEYYEDRFGHDYLAADELRDQSSFYTHAAFGGPRTYAASQFPNPPPDYFESYSRGVAVTAGGGSAQQLMDTVTKPPPATKDTPSETPSVAAVPVATEMFPCELVKQLHLSYDQDIRPFLPYQPIPVQSDGFEFNGADLVKSPEVQKVLESYPILREAAIYSITKDLRLFIPGIWAGQYAPRIMDIEQNSSELLLARDVPWKEGLDFFKTEAGWFVALSRLPIVLLWTPPHQFHEHTEAVHFGLQPSANPLIGVGNPCQKPIISLPQTVNYPPPPSFNASWLYYSGPNALFQLIETIPAAIEAAITGDTAPMEETAQAKLIRGDITGVEDYFGNIAETLGLFQ